MKRGLSAAATVAMGLVVAAACRRHEKPPDPAVLLQALKDPRQDVSGPATLAVIRLGEPAVPGLIELLSDPDPRLRAKAASTLWGMGDRGKTAVPALCTALGDSESTVRVGSAMALENMGPAAADAVPALVTALGHPDGDVRVWAAKALGKIGPQARPALPALKRAARHELVREAAEESIRQIQSVPASP
jgi:HEAT repeat protein